MTVRNGVSPWIVDLPSFGEPTGFTRTGHLRRPPRLRFRDPFRVGMLGGQETQGFTLGCITTPPWGFQKCPFGPNNPFQNGIYCPARISLVISKATSKAAAPCCPVTVGSARSRTLATNARNWSFKGSSFSTSTSFLLICKPSR